MSATPPWWTPSSPQRFAWNLFVLWCPHSLLFSQCPLLEGRLCANIGAFWWWNCLFSAQTMSAVCSAVSDWLWETAGNADVGKWGASMHEATRNWLARLCPLFLYRVLCGLSLVRQMVFPGIKVSLKAAVTLVNLYTTFLWATKDHALALLLRAESLLRRIPSSKCLHSYNVRMTE